MPLSPRRFATHRLRFPFLKAVLLPALLAAAAPAWAEQAEPLLVGDLSPGTFTLHFLPGELTTAGDRLYFNGFHLQHGEEPWVSDGTPAGTRMLGDLCPGPCSSQSRYFTQIGDRVVFYSRDGQKLQVLHPGGQVETIARGVGELGGIAKLGDIAYFGAGFVASGMMRTDGTAAGTYPTRDFCGTEACLSVALPLALPGGLFFNQGGYLHRLEAEGRRHRLTESGALQAGVALDSRRVVLDLCTSSGCRAWVSDGTPQGTRQLETGAVPNGGQPRALVAWQGRVYFSDRQGGMKSTDGTPEGTRAEPSFGAGAGSPAPLAATPNALLYAVRTGGAGSGLELRSRRAGGADVQLLTASQLLVDETLGGRVFLLADRRLVTTDGSAEGTLTLAETLGFQPGTIYRGAFYFGLQRIAEGSGVWRSDGTAAGTAPADLGFVAPQGTWAVPHRLGSSLAADLLIPSGNGGINLYRIDTQSFAVSEVDPFGLSTLAVGNERLFAVGVEDGRLRALSETAVVELPHGAPAEAAIGGGSRLYFTEEGVGRKLFESDGSVAGTRELFDLAPGYVRPPCSGESCEPLYPAAITPSGDSVFFLAPRREDGEDVALSLWRWRSGEPLAELPASPYQILGTAPGGRVVFSQFENGQDYGSPRLFASDGTVAGTRPFHTLSSLGPLRHATAGGRYFFTQRDGLWASDLTEAGTTLVLPGDGQAITELVPAGDAVFFAGKPRPGEDAELGVSHGTAAGTRWLERIPGPDGLRPERLFALADGRMVFAGSGDGAGQELWISDGTLLGTRRLTDLAPGAAASSPRHFAQVGNRLFFNASDDVAGFELWALDLPAPGETSCTPERPCLGGDRFVVSLVAHAPDGNFPARQELSNASSAVFSFFSPGNWEMLLKVLDGCAVNGHFWVYAAAATDAGWTLRILDRETGAERIYGNAPGQASRAITDAAAFSCGGALSLLAASR